MSEQQWKMVPVALLAEAELTLRSTGESVSLSADLRKILEATQPKSPGYQEFSVPDCTDCACVQDGKCLCIPSKPPALGGELEVLGYSVKGNRYAIRLTKGELLELHEGYSGDALIELVDRAHVGLIQAEVERLKGRAVTGVKEEVFDIVCKERDGACARTAALEGLLRMFIDNSDDSDVIELSRNALAEGSKS